MRMGSSPNDEDSLPSRLAQRRRWRQTHVPGQEKAHFLTVKNCDWVCGLGVRIGREFAPHPRHPLCTTDFVWINEILIDWHARYFRPRQNLWIRLGDVVRPGCGPLRSPLPVLSFLCRTELCSYPTDRQTDIKF